jgi:hypothetical protein
LRFSDAGGTNYWEIGRDNGVNGSFTITQNGTERLCIDYLAGNVGIGTSSPSSALDVSGAISLGAVAIPSAGTARIYSRNTDSNLYIQTAGGNTVNLLDGSQNTLASFGASAVSLNTGNVARLSIDSTGRVGIGTTSPGSILTVSDPGTGLQFTNAASGNYNIGLLAGTGSTDAYVFNRANSALIFGTNNTERARIDSVGNLMVGGTSNALSSRILSENASGNQIAIRYTSVATYYLNATSGGDLGINKDGAERLRIDSSGRLLVGTSSSYGVQATIAGAAGAVSTGSGSYAVLSLADTNAVATGVGGGIAFQGNDGVNGLVTFSQIQGFKENSTSGNYAGGLSFSVRQNAANVTERMRIDSSGRLLVGSTVNNTGSLIQVKQDNNLTSTTINVSTAGGLSVESVSGNANYGSGIWFDHGSLRAGIASSRITTGNWGTDLRFYTHPDSTSGPAQFEIIERMRINSSGAVQIGSTAQLATELFRVTSSNTWGAAIEVTGNVSGDRALYLSMGTNTNNTSSYFIDCSTATVGAKFYVYGNGTYGTVSDINLKKNIETTRDGYLEDIQQLRVVKYNWKTDKNDAPKELGWIAQELAEVFPGLVQDSQPDASGNTVKEVKTSVLQFILLKALQEAASKIKALEARLTAAGIE